MQPPLPQVIQYLANCWITIFRTWMNGWDHPLQFCEGRLTHWGARLVFRGTQTGWRNEMTGASWSSAEGSVKTPSMTDWGPTGQKATLQEMTCRPWWTRGFIMSQPWAHSRDQARTGWTTKGIASKMREVTVLLETISGILDLVLDSLVWKRHQQQRDHRDNRGQEQMMYKWGVQGDTCVKSEDEKALRWSHCCLCLTHGRV